MVTEIRGPTQGGLDRLIQVNHSPPGVVSKDSKASSAIENKVRDAQQTNVVSSQEIQNAVQQADQNPEGLGVRLDVVGAYVLPIMYLATQVYTVYRTF